MLRLKKIEVIPHDLMLAQELAYNSLGLIFGQCVLERESLEYGACTFTMSSKTVKFRQAKITPTKIGQFVTFWKRIGQGPIMPYDLNDSFDFFVVSVRTLHYFGQFIFPKSVLVYHGLVSQGGKGGKRAMRVYPPWDTPDNAQAKKTQAWQLRYFFEIQPNLARDQFAKLFF